MVAIDNRDIVAHCSVGLGKGLSDTRAIPLSHVCIDDEGHRRVRRAADVVVMGIHGARQPQAFGRGNR